MWHEIGFRDLSWVEAWFMTGRDSGLSCHLKLSLSLLVGVKMFFTSFALAEFSNSNTYSTVSLWNNLLATYLLTLFSLGAKIIHKITENWKIVDFQINTFFNTSLLIALKSLTRVSSKGSNKYLITLLKIFINIQTMNRLDSWKIFDTVYLEKEAC